MVAATNSLHEVEKLYKAYYGRPADQEGAAYWTAKLDASGGDVSKIAGAFAHSEEASSLYGGLDDQAKVGKIYEQVFGRHADADGLNFYVGKLHSGEMTPDTIMLNVLDGAKGDDLTKLDGDVEEAVGQLDASHIDALVEHYRSTIQAEDSPDHSGSVSSDSVSSGSVSSGSGSNDAATVHIESHGASQAETPETPETPETHVQGMDDHGIGLVGVVSAADGIPHFDM